MHSGFTDLRSLCGMNIRANLAEVGTKLWQEHSGLRQDVARIEHIWSARPAADGFLCGEFSIADAFLCSCGDAFYDLCLACKCQQPTLYAAGDAASCYARLGTRRITRSNVGQLFRALSKTKQNDLEKAGLGKILRKFLCGKVVFLFQK